jgi:hypothetical protein
VLWKRPPFRQLFCLACGATGVLAHRWARTPDALPRYCTIQQLRANDATHTKDLSSFAGARKNQAQGSFAALRMTTRNLSTNYLLNTPCAAAGFSLSIRNESRPARLVMCGHRFLNQCLNERGLTRNLIWCAMLRHAERPKGSRRVPYVYRRFILGPFTRSRGSAFSTLLDCFFCVRCASN